MIYDNTLERYVRVFICFANTGAIPLKIMYQRSGILPDIAKKYCLSTLAKKEKVVENREQLSRRLG
jgi:hypothetical protein